MFQRFREFVMGITVCHKYISRIKSVEMTELGLKGKHAMCLFFLHEHPDGLTAAQLSGLCAEDKAAISRTVGLLQERGYIMSTGKKYRAKLTLTPAGEQVATQIGARIERWVDCGGDGLTEEERRIFYSALAHIAANLQRRLEEME